MCVNQCAKIMITAPRVIAIMVTKSPFLLSPRGASFQHIPDGTRMPILWKTDEAICLPKGEGGTFIDGICHIPQHDNAHDGFGVRVGGIEAR